VQFVPGPPPLSLSRLTRLTQVCKSWRWELVAGGFCSKTTHLCSVFAEGGGGIALSWRLRQNALRRLNASIDNSLTEPDWWSRTHQERAVCADGIAFLAKSHGWKGSLREWLQAASQEPDASFLSRGAASTAQSLGLTLVQWVGKPQGRFPGSHTLPGHSREVDSVALSRDGKRAASGSSDKFVKIWNAETGAEVSSLE